MTWFDMNTEDAIKDARRLYDKHPQLAFSMLLDVVEAQNKALRCSILWAGQLHGDHGIRQLLGMLDLSSNTEATNAGPEPKVNQ